MAVDITRDICVFRLWQGCLGDPKNNEVEVQVEIKNNKVFFKNGWFGLKDFYNVDIGAWATLIYEHPRLLRMTLKNRFDEELEYPDCTLLIISKLDRGLCRCSSLIFCAASVIKLTAADVNSGSLVHVCHSVCLFLAAGFA